MALNLNLAEKIGMHAIDLHPHHNTGKLIPVERIKELNRKANERYPGLIVIGPETDDDAGVINIPLYQGKKANEILKLESHCSPAAIDCYGAIVTMLSGCIRDIVAMGGEPLAVMDFFGVLSLNTKLLVGPCALKGDGKTCCCAEDAEDRCKEMTGDERLKIMFEAFCDACEALTLGVVAGGISTSIRGPVPAAVGAVVGREITAEPLTKGAKNVGDKIILVGLTGNDGTDTMHRAFPDDFPFIPAKPLFAEERTSMDGMLEAHKVDKANACADLGAAGIFAAICESVRKGGLGALVNLALVPLTEDGKNNTPMDTLLRETQGRYTLQVSPENVDEVLKAIRSVGATATVIGEITNGKEAIFMFKDDTVATIPNNPSAEMLEELERMVS